MSESLSLFLNMSRWMAAFLVVINHVRHLILVEFQLVEEKTLFWKGFYFATGFGHESVIIFFVISGFLVGGLTLDRWKVRGTDFREYSCTRLSRIYTVLIPALVMGLIIDLVGFQWVNASELYTNSDQYRTEIIDNPIIAAVSFTIFTSNLLMMQGIYSGNFGSNGPLWSLAYEWWYYCVFALMAGAFIESGRNRVIYAILAAILLIWLPFKIVLWGVIWMLGIAAHAWIRSQRLQPHPVLGFGLFFIALVVSRLSHNQDNNISYEPIYIEFFRDLMLGIGFVFAMVSAVRMKVQVPFARLHLSLAEFSYTTYLFHFPVMVFIVAFAVQYFGYKIQVQPGMYALLYFVILVLLLYAYCFAFSELTEKHTPWIKKRLLFFVRPRSNASKLQTG